MKYLFSARIPREIIPEVQARQAMQFGAIWGQGNGLQGQTYAIPTMFAHQSKIEPYTDDFISFTKRNPNLFFFVTRIGCGIAGFTEKQIAPLFERVKAEKIENVYLPKEFLGGGK